MKKPALTDDALAAVVQKALETALTSAAATTPPKEPAAPAVVEKSATATTPAPAAAAPTTMQMSETDRMAIVKSVLEGFAEMNKSQAPAAKPAAAPENEDEQLVERITMQVVKALGVKNADGTVTLANGKQSATGAASNQKDLKKRLAGAAAGAEEDDDLEASEEDDELESLLVKSRGARLTLNRQLAGLSKEDSRKALGTYVGSLLGRRN